MEYLSTKFNGLYDLAETLRTAAASATNDENHQEFLYDLAFLVEDAWKRGDENLNLFVDFV